LEKYKNKYRAQSFRFPNWDYGSAGMYFITICTQNRACFFGKITDGKMRLSPIGQIAQTEWLKTFATRPDMHLFMGEFVVMPNHFHAVIGIGQNQYNSPNNSANPDGLSATDIMSTGAMHRTSTENGISATDEMNRISTENGLSATDAMHLLSATDAMHRTSPENGISAKDEMNRISTENGISATDAKHPLSATDAMLRISTKDDKYHIIDTIIPIIDGTEYLDDDIFLLPTNYPIKTKNKFGPQAKNLASVIRGFKSAVTMAARQIDPNFQWQSLYHDHIIRNNEAYGRISDYIINNPLKWKEDCSSTPTKK
jgi:REP element-mobilizing transposase RayT